MGRLITNGLRVSEAIRLDLSDIDLQTNTIYVQRLKQGLSTEHPITQDDRLALTRYLTIRAPTTKSTTLFLSERGASLSRQQVQHLVQRYGEIAKLPLGTFPHMLRHACGYALANKGADTQLIQDYLGHRSIQSTVRYTATNAQRFRTLWGEACVPEKSCSSEETQTKDRGIYEQHHL